MKLLHWCAPPASRIACRARSIAGSSGDIPDELECEIRLDRRTDFGRPTGIDRPPAVALLMVEDIPWAPRGTPGRIRGPERPSARHTRTRGSYRPRARRPSNLHRFGGRAASGWFVRERSRVRRQQHRRWRRLTGAQPFRSSRQDASVLVGDHALPTLSLIPRCLFVGKFTSNVSRLIWIRMLHSQAGRILRAFLGFDQDQTWP